MATSSMMNSLKRTEEVLLISTCGAEDQNWNVGVWDAKTGSLLHSYRNGSAAPKSLCVLNGECLVASSHSKPIIHAWSMLRQGQKHRKLICSGKVSCLTATPDSKYIAAGIEDKIHIWQVSTGELFSVLSYSSVELTCLKFSASGQHLVSGYRDGAVAVWELQDVLYLDPTQLEGHSPVNTFLGHGGEITDVHITLSGQVASSSLDFTVRLWNLLSKEELKMFELGAPITSVVVDHPSLTLYAGDINGNVYCIDLHYQAAERLLHVDTSENTSGFTCLKAHLSRVTHMALMRDQSKLVTASDDKTVKIWSMMSSVAPLTITLNEKVSNLAVLATPQALINPEEKPRVLIGNLKRELHNTEENKCDDIFLDNRICYKLPKLCGMSSITSDEPSVTEKPEALNESLVSSEEVESLKQKANKLKKANEEIYNFALKEIVK
ncbi:unnamed protein product [Candidula unifasciata]|uniref:TEP-1 C-terminal beta-propeller domain-containing protein n=1 Tax=Candidula unifasciata TaxID=100452 RepID=A0A8S3ZY62_9EUPU|nr:unnamed protein product [Candidula unifasciata]